MTEQHDFYACDLGPMHGMASTHVGKDGATLCDFCGHPVATPSARITGDKDRESQVEGAPYGEGLIGRIDQLQSELLEQASLLDKSAEREARLAAMVRELERVLGEYGKHPRWCSVHLRRSKSRATCSCGLTQALKDQAYADRLVAI